jgi:hypothetical protein
MRLERSTLFAGRSAPDQSRVKFFSIMQNSSSRSCSNLKLKSTALNSFPANRITYAVAERSQDPWGRGHPLGYHPRGRGKIERYHKTLYLELIALKEFRSLNDFKRELWNFDQFYNNWRKQEILAG